MGFELLRGMVPVIWMVGNVDGVASVVLVVRAVGLTLTRSLHLVALVVVDEAPEGQAQQRLFLR